MNNNNNNMNENNKNNSIIFHNFNEFWPFYVSQHQNAINRLLHVIGTILGFTFFIYFTVNNSSSIGLVIGLIIGYFCAWSGHYIFEKNKPATFRFPIYSFLGDIKMFFLTITGKQLLTPFQKKVILITGASRGIGLGIVRLFLNQGHHVFAGVRNCNLTNIDLNQLKNQFPNQLSIVELDVTNDSQAKLVLTQILSAVKQEEFILINNAGISGGGPFELMTQKHWQDMYQVNVLGLVNISRVFLEHIRKTKGRIINIGSISGRITSPFMTSYSSTKYAVRAITDGLRRELVPFEVAVILIEPGPIETDIWNTSMQNSLDMIGTSSKELIELYEDNISKLKTDIQDISKSTVSIDYLLSYINKAVNLKNPSSYYRVGKNIGIIFILSLMPSFILDRLLTSGLRFKKLK